MNEDAFIIGYGMVGRATARALNIPWYISRLQSNINLEDASKKLYCIICLPTPTDENGDQDESVKVIYEYIQKIQQYGGKNIFVIRSTVLPGTCRELAKITDAMVVSNPEFLSEATAEEDAMHPRIKVIGADDQSALMMVKKLWQSVPCKLEIETDTVTSEMIKYTFNTFSAVKGVFANQIYDACLKNGADYKKIHYALHNHPWGSREHLRPVDKGGRGIGGRCIPKDLLAFTTFTNSPFLEIVQELNNDYLEESKKV